MRIILKSFCVLSLGLSLLLSLTAPAAAATPKQVGKFGFWSAYTLDNGKEKVCYMTLTAHPPAPTKKSAKRGDITLMITHRPAEMTLNVVSYSIGTKFKPASEAIVKIGKNQFNLFTQGDTAWSRDSNTDRTLSNAIRAGSSLSLTGTAANGSLLTDTVQLKGSEQAYRAISKNCGLNVPDPPSPPTKKAKKVTKSKE